MADWTAVVPIKPPTQRKTRLAEALDETERLALAERLLAHVIATLRSAEEIEQIFILSTSRPIGWIDGWIVDQARGLNVELQEACRAMQGNIIVIHGDLPLLSTTDVAALIAAAAGENGIAIAPDRHGTGTNAIALWHGAALRFAFGPDSFSRHVAATGGGGTIVRRPGLALDIDTPDDLVAMRAADAVPKCHSASLLL